jgi:hypothetical protein
MSAATTSAASTALLGPELERRAAEIRRQQAEESRRQAEEKAERDRFAAQQKAEAATFALALARTCPDHDARPGNPCWRVAPDDVHHRPNRAVCGRRIAQALGVAQLRRQREAREQQRAKLAEAGRPR